MTLDFATIVSICGGIMAIWAVVKLVNAPLADIKKNRDDIDKLKEEQSTRKQMDKAMLNSLQAITNHMIDGNGIDKLRESRDELQKAISEIATK